MFSNKISKFEKAKAIGTRATQISNGAPPKVDITGLDTSLSIAEKEFNEGKIPIIINRKFANITEKIKLYK